MRLVHPPDIVLRRFLNGRSKNQSRVIKCNAGAATSAGQGRLSAKGLRLKELEHVFESHGVKSARYSAQTVYKRMYKEWITDENVDSLRHRHPKINQGATDVLKAVATLDGDLVLHDVKESRDGTVKFLFDCSCGAETPLLVDTVLIPMLSGPKRAKRYTVCVSSQVGCAQNCQFCFTGRMGLLRQLSAAQIVEQLVAVQRFMQERGITEDVANIVFMGQGEPLHNFDNVITAVDIMSENVGLRIAAKKITVSTVGLVPEIRQFVRSSKARLAVSLHATTDDVRDWIVPVNLRHNLAELLSTLEELFPADGSDFVLIEYVLLKGVNDSLEDAQRLGHMLKRIHCAVNLIMYNSHEGAPFKAAETPAVLQFRDTMRARGKLCTIRESKGDDEMAACGQLGSADRQRIPVKQVPMLLPS